MAERLVYRQGLRGRRALFLSVAALLLVALLPTRTLSALSLAQRSIRVNNTLAAQSGVTYGVSFATPANSLIGSVRVQFCSNTPLVDDPCAAPNDC